MEVLTQFFVSAVSWLLAMFFAAVWGAHLFYGTVIFPASASELPKSFLEWVATPYAMRLHAFFKALVPGLYTVSSIGLVVAAVTGLRMRPALAVSAACGLIHWAMVVVIFMPMNLKLGLQSGGPGASSLDPQTIKTLVQRWGRWHFVRLGVETAGLIAALFAFKAS